MRVARKAALLGLPALLGLAVGGSLVLAQQPQRNVGLSDAERAQCLARHGRVLIAGFSGNEVCALPYADAGRRCTSGSQCAGDCMYDGPAPRPGQRVTGRCEALQYGFGCRTTLENGRIAYAICTD
ncbi:MAG TPA: hypothetical protein VEC11_09560 [Allosphingosinicella sp.]|nr:hypothetical protein [Allosphingosinicella sp.]